MKLKIALTCAALLLTPGIAAAMGCSKSHEKQAMTCAEGSVYDADSGTCVATTT